MADIIIVDSCVCGLAQAAKNIVEEEGVSVQVISGGTAQGQQIYQIAGVTSGLVTFNVATQTAVVGIKHTLIKNLARKSKDTK